MKYIDIDLTQSKVRVPNKTIGKQGESFATGIRFKLQPEYSGWGVFVDIETPNGEKSRVELADVRDNVAIYEVSGEELEYNGRLKLDLVLSNETSISKPFSGEFTIKRAICAENPQEGEIPIILTSDMVARIEKIEKDAERLNYNIVGRLSESEDGQLMFDGAPIGKDVEREIYAEDIKYENPQIAEDSDNLKEAIDELANYTITSVEIMDGSISALFDESHSHTFDEKVLNRLSDKSGVLYYSGSPIGNGGSNDVEVSVKSNTETEYILTFKVGDKIFDTPNLIGSDGTIGKDGVGISSVTLNEDYTLTITFDNGESFTTSSIRGEKGEKGDNYVLTDADKEEIISDLIEKIPQNNVSAEDVAYTTPYMPGATNVKEALDATGEGFVSITQNINDIHENFMRTADAEQKIEDALASAKASGEFDGEKGESIAVRNINHSTEDGGENIVYFTDGNVLSVKNGNTGADGKDGVDGKDGANGIDGKNGVTFTPIVSDDGTLSWTNDGELENPAEINIKGEAGKSGVYIGDGDMPDDCDVQINPNGMVLRVPTKTSELVNDSGFITAEDLPESDFSKFVEKLADGVNQYEPQTEGWTDDGYIVSSGEVKVNTTSYKSYAVTPAIPVKGGTTYTVKPIFNTVTSIADKSKARTYDSTGAALSEMVLTVNEDSVTFTTPENSETIRFTVQAKVFGGREVVDANDIETVINTFNSSFMLVEGTEAPEEYEPFGNSGYKLKDIALPDKSVNLESVSDEALPIFASLAGKKIANFGDSIFGNARPPKDVSTFLAEKTGAEVLNCAFGGCRMGVHTGHWDAFSMYRLAYAIANNDYSLQDDALNYDDRVSYAETPLALIKSTDFSTVDILTIGYGTNDFTGGNALDNEENSLDTSTLAGALRYSIETLLTAFPNLRIFILSTTYRFWKDDNNEYTEDSKTYLNKHNKTLPEYNAKLKEVAEEYNLPFIDNYNIGIGKFNRYQYFPVTDGTHHNETGRKLIAEHLAGALTNASNATPSKSELVNAVLAALPKAEEDEF